MGNDIEEKMAVMKILTYRWFNQRFRSFQVSTRAMGGNEQETRNVMDGNKGEKRAAIGCNEVTSER
jgi:hypothetical protein